MRKMAILAGMGAALLAVAAAADVDLKDFDDDLMKNMGDTIKLLEPDINAKNLDAANQEVAVFTDGFKYVEDYFAAKGNAGDAVQFAHDSRGLTDAVRTALAAKDFDAAAAAARNLSKSCKSCHDVYKPL
jgi:cytochrome c556